MTERTAFLFCLSFCAGTLHAQTFEVASVKPAAMLNAESKRGLITADPAQISYTFLPLGVLLEKAYDLKSYQIAGPDWIKTERYDIVAKPPPGSTEKQIQTMLRILLSERF